MPRRALWVSPEISAEQWGKTGCLLMVVGCSSDLGAGVASPQCPAERWSLWHHDEHGLVSRFCFRPMDWIHTGAWLCLYLRYFIIWWLLIIFIVFVSVKGLRKPRFLQLRPRNFVNRVSGGILHENFETTYLRVPEELEGILPDLDVSDTVLWFPKFLSRKKLASLRKEL